jgi:hypothetical protein
MSTISLTLPDPVYQQVQESAKRSGISVGEYLASALAEKLASDAYLDARARRSSREGFDWALAQVPDVPPIRGDEL